MKRTIVRNALVAAALVGATAVGITAWSHPGGGYGGYGMGPGMMGGYGGYGGYGMGPGMMGGYGMGPGMMGGYGGGYGGGPGAMGGYGPGYGSAPLNLTDEQREKIEKIQEDAANRRWDLMQKSQDEQFRLQDLYTANKRDDAAVRKSREHLTELRHQMFENDRNARKQMDAILTAEQRDRMHRGAYGGWGY